MQITRIVKYLDGTVKKYATAAELAKDSPGRTFFIFADSYDPSTNTLTIVEGPIRK